MDTSQTPIDKVTAPPVPARKRKRQGQNRYYLEDHPILVPVITLVLGGLCLYSTIFSHLLQDLLLPGDADRTLRDNFYTGASWGIAFVVGIMGIALMFLLWHGVDSGLRALRNRRPVTCPRCGATETPGAPRFARQPVEGTGWQTLTCAQCGNSWYGKT